MARNIRFDGPLFDGEAAREFASFKRQAQQDIATVGVSMIRQRLQQVLERQTGRYISSVRVERRDSHHEITDGGIVYGPWLEGISSRNRTTRFKGYKTFRQTRGQIQRKAPAIARRTLRPYLARMS